MLNEFLKAIESMESYIATQERQIQLLKKDLDNIKKIIQQQANTTDYIALPESLEKLFDQFYIQDDTGIAVRAYHDI